MSFVLMPEKYSTIVMKDATMGKKEDGTEFDYKYFPILYDAEGKFGVIPTEENHKQFPLGQKMSQNNSHYMGVLTESYKFDMVAHQVMARGVVPMPKEKGTGKKIPGGVMVYWDISKSVVKSHTQENHVNATIDYPLGVAYDSAEDDDIFVSVKLLLM